MLNIREGISISEDELIFKASRSSGPGGQNVNKVNTKITLFFDVAGCKSLSEPQKRQIFAHKPARIDSAGVIRISSQKFRTQQANRKAAVERFQKLLADALKDKLIRKKTKIPYSAKIHRLDKKRKRGQLKHLRTAKNFDF
jgi:ribosome-associated protein